MKKVILKTSCIAFIGWAFLSCEKEVQNKPTYSLGSENVFIDDDSKAGNNYNDKAGNGNGIGNPNANQVDDAYLIEAIHGTNSEYVQLEMLEKLLLDNAPLSEAVLLEVINADQITDEITEMLMVVSTPFQDNVMGELNSRRPAMPLQSIQESRTRPSNQRFAVVFTNPKTVIFGRDLNRASLGLSGCQSCSSEITGSADARLIRLIKTDDTPAPIGGGCNSANQICGLPSIASEEKRRGNKVKYTVFCNMNFPNEHCVY